MAILVTKEVSEPHEPSQKVSETENNYSKRGYLKIDICPFFIYICVFGYFLCNFQLGFPKEDEIGKL